MAAVVVRNYVPLPKETRRLCTDWPPPCGRCPLGQKAVGLGRKDVFRREAPRSTLGGCLRWEPWAACNRDSE